MIFVAGDLNKSSSIRKFFESAASLLSIGCYKPDQNYLKRMILSFLDSRELKYHSDVVDTIIEILPASEQIVINELNKLVTYLGERKHVVYEDIVAVIGGTGELSLDDLCIALVNKDMNQVQSYLNTLQCADVNFMLIIRMVANFIFKVVKLKSLVEEGKSLEQAIFHLKPPVFFKQKNNLMTATKKLSLDESLSALKKLLEIELKCKKGLTKAETILNQEFSLWA